MTSNDFHTQLNALREQWKTADEATKKEIEIQAEELKEQYYQRHNCRAPGCSERVRGDTLHFPFCSEPHHKLYATDAYRNPKPVVRKPTWEELAKQMRENKKQAHLKKGGEKG